MPGSVLNVIVHLKQHIFRLGGYSAVTLIVKGEWIWHLEKFIGYGYEARFVSNGNGYGYFFT